MSDDRGLPPPGEIPRPRLRLVNTTPDPGPAELPAPAGPPPNRPDDHAQRLVPRSVKVALIIVGIEALLLLMLMAFLISTVVQDVEANPGVTWATMVFSMLMFLGVLAGAMAVLRGRRWGRSPLVAWQVLQLVTAAPSLVSRSWWLAGGLVILSVAGLGALMSPGVTRHLHWREVPERSPLEEIEDLDR